MLCCCWLGGRKGIRPAKKLSGGGAGVVICLERGADLHMAQLMPLLLTVSCFSKIQIGFAFLVSAVLGSPGKGPLNGCVCVLLQYLAKCLACFFRLTVCSAGVFLSPCSVTVTAAVRADHSVTV